MSSPLKIIAVIGGATGLQGRCVVDALISLHNSTKVDDFNFRIRVLTRNPNSNEAKKLAHDYQDIVEVMYVDCTDRDSVLKAFKDCYGVFSYTTPFVGGNFLKVNDESAKSEIQQGINMIDAAIENKVTYFVFGSVMSANLNPPVLRFKTKYEIEKYLLEKKSNFQHGILIVRPSVFMEDVTKVIPVKKGQFSLTLSPNRKIQWVAFEDVANLIANAFKNPQLYSKYDALDLSSDEITPNELAQILSKTTKHEVKYTQPSLKDRLIFKYTNPELYSMFDYLQTVGFKGDINECYQLYPNFQTLEQYATKHFAGNNYGKYEEKNNLWNSKNIMVGVVGLSVSLAIFYYKQMKK